MSYSRKSIFAIARSIVYGHASLLLLNVMYVGEDEKARKKRIKESKEEEEDNVECSYYANREAIAVGNREAILVVNLHLFAP